VQFSQGPRLTYCERGPFEFPGVHILRAYAPSGAQGDYGCYLSKIQDALKLHFLYPQLIHRLVSQHPKAWV